MSNIKIIPSSQEFKSAPSVDQEISITLEEKSQQITEYDRNSTVGLAQVFDDERQASAIFRPTFKVNFLYDNTITGTTQYIPFRNNLWYIDNVNSMASGIWKGLPQYYEFDFYRPSINDQHLNYKSKSAYTYNWTYYLSYPFENDENKDLYYSLDNTSQTWKASEGIPFSINNITQNGSNIISFQCIAPHGLSVGEYVQLSFDYNGNNLFEVFSLGNDNLNSQEYIFNIFNIGYTGTTFANNVAGKFKRVINPENILETTSKYYVRKHKIITNLEDLIIVKNAFEKNIFNEDKKLEFSSITPNQITRISQKNSSNSYNITSAIDLNFEGILDNQKRPLTKVFLTIINKGYTGYFNQPFNGVGLKQGWQFNITPQTNSWWDLNNEKSNSNVLVSGYTKSSGVTRTFYYNLDLFSGFTMDGDFCEWNDYEQIERTISPYFHKLKYNQNIFSNTNELTTNPPGYYYQPHNEMTIRVFSDYVETGSLKFIEQVPGYSYFSNSDQQFRWRDLYTYGFIDVAGNGVDYPFLNNAHYPYKEINFRLIPEGINYNADLQGITIPYKPIIDGCE